MIEDEECEKLQYFKEQEIKKQNDRDWETFCSP